MRAFPTFALLSVLALASILDYVAYLSRKHNRYKKVVRGTRYLSSFRRTARSSSTVYVNSSVDPSLPSTVVSPNCSSTKIHKSALKQLRTKTRLVHKFFSPFSGENAAVAMVGVAVQL
jgi:hypothetical protein